MRLKRTVQNITVKLRGLIAADEQLPRQFWSLKKRLTKRTISGFTYGRMNVKVTGRQMVNGGEAEQEEATSACKGTFVTV